MADHKPIIHRKCGRRMPDRDERYDRKTGKSLDKGDDVCLCGHGGMGVMTPVRKLPIDLEWYDKNLK